jgi:thioredoxin reductase
VSRTVDLVIADAGDAALAAAVQAVPHGRRVLVLLRHGDARAGSRVRRRLRQAAPTHGAQVMVMTNVEVVCVDGVDGVEAVVIRHARTGRLSAVNATAFVSCESAALRQRA